jgi:hypothetical protein
MEGRRCSHSDCQTSDFLPFLCEYCHQEYCLEHRSRFIHNCIDCGDQQQSNNTSATGSSQSVRQIFSDVEHRFDNEPKYDTSDHFNIKSSQREVDEYTAGTAFKIEKLDSTIDSTNSTKNRNIANKTKQILFKNRASGNEGIAPEDRFYLECHFLLTEEKRFLYFTKYQTVGEMIELLSSHYPLLAYNLTTRPTDLSLAVLTSPETPLPSTDEALLPLLLSCNRNNLLSKQFEEFSTLYLLPVSLRTVLEAQNTLQSQQQEPSLSSLSALSPPPSDNHKQDITSNDLSATLPHLPLHEYISGDSILYARTPSPDQEQASSSEPWWGSIIAVHRDDTVPYYTIRIMEPGTGKIKEKQTDGKYLYLSSSLSTTFPSLASVTTSPDQLFTIKFSYQGQIYLNSSIPRSGTVLSLKQSILQMSGLTEKGLNIFNLKLISKGKILKKNEWKLRGKELSLVDGGTIMIMKEQSGS